MVWWLLFFCWFLIAIFALESPPAHTKNLKFANKLHIQKITNQIWTSNWSLDYFEWNRFDCWINTQTIIFVELASPWWSKMSVAIWCHCRYNKSSIEVHVSTITRQLHFTISRWKFELNAQFGHSTVAIESIWIKLENKQFEIF